MDEEEVMAFQVLPVVDLRRGLVVHARAGARERYAPLSGSVLCASARPQDVINGFLALYPFRDIYLADLDAIAGEPAQTALIKALEAQFPDVTFWLDAGFATEEGVRSHLAEMRGRCVLGSESQRDRSLVARFRTHERIVLSLDHRGDERLGPPELFTEPSLWPQRVIVMTLGRVGTGAGPDSERLSAVRAAAPDRLVYAAGGIRGEADLDALKRSGYAGALVATALHSARIGAHALQRLAL
jgi:phosphoribosylformimino-5-aminoimidazole carboxamide ribotide isomerase